MAFKALFGKWAQGNAEKKLGQAIEKRDLRAVQSYLSRSPQKFHYVLYDTNTDTTRINEKVPVGVFGNPIDLARRVGFPEAVPFLRQAGFVDTQAPSVGNTVKR